MAVRREAFAAVGGFPEVDVTAGEDTALCDRFLQRWPAGLRFVRRMRVRHDGRRTLGELARHQWAFGYVRGVLGLHLSENYRRWGARAVTLPAVVLKRLAYIAGRTIRFDPAATPRAIVLLPVILVGLMAWALGFRRGCGAPFARAELQRTAAGVDRVEA
jgi:GT2 family glycosyltransferase